MQIIHLDTVDSTNRLALEAREPWHVFWADRQTAGRGQHGRRWESAARKGLWFSVCLPGPPQGLHLAAALAVRDALSPYAPVTLKWPNDLLLDNRKVCGILIEHCDGWNAVGIGLNVLHNPEDFPEELRYTATSLAQYNDRQWDRESLLHDMVECLESWVRTLNADGYDTVFSTWAEACDIVGRHIERDGVTGKVIALDHDGALCVDTPGGIVRIDSGCVVILEEP